MLKKILKYLSSPRFTILLICLLGAIFAIGLWIPQIHLVQAIYAEWHRNSPRLVDTLDFFGLTTIYTSPITITLWVFFFINLALVLWQRMPLVRMRIAISDAKITDPEKTPGYSFKSSFPLPAGFDQAAVIAGLRKGHFTVLGDAANFYAVKNRLSPIAFMLFHLSFYLILLGGMITLYTEFIGYMDLAQGEAFHGDLSSYNASPAVKMPAFGSPPKLSFTVTSIVPKVIGNTPTSISVKLLDDNGQTHEVGINAPYTTGGTSFLFKHLGMAPRFVIKDASGRVLDDAIAKLDVLKMAPDRFVLAGYNFKATFYPDFVMEKGKRATRSMEFGKKMFFLTVERDGKKIAEGLVPENGTLDFDGKRLEMPELRFWVRFYVITQQGLPILYLGFAVACIAVIWRMIFYKREIVGAVREKNGVPSLVVAGRSEYYKSLTEDEFNKLFNKILGRPDEDESIKV